ncbi:MAG: hypothetical protein ACREQ9_26560, partial [Candidatus Binatia bacterium]
MRLATTTRLAVAAALLLGTTAARADYHSEPGLKPSSRCGEALRVRGTAGSDNVGDYGPGCQSLIWDLPATTELEQPVRVETDPNTGFKHGLTDRPPPMYVGTVGGVGDGFERLEDCQSKAGDCERLCPNPLEVPWWAPAVEDGDGTARRQVECRRGVRVTYGPWQTGTSPRVDDRVAEAVVRFEN